MATTFIAEPASMSLLDRARAIPGMRQLVLLFGLAGAIAGGLSLFMWANKPGMQPLYAGLPESDVAAMAASLAAANIPHAIDAGTGALTVPADQLRSARLKLAGEGLPKSGSVGFESLQGEQGFGISQAVESSRMQHALETELVRTISALQPVKTARVHLALPKPSAFTRGSGSASASVLVELHPGRALTSQQVQSIVHMVAASVPEMPTSAVTVVDQTGRLLTDDSAEPGAGMGSSQYEQIKRVEDATRHRIEDILTPLMGAGRVKSQVVANLDFTVQEETQERYEPDEKAIRSEQTNEDVNRSGGLKMAQGVPGATSNQPPAAAPATTPATPSAAAATPPAGGAEPPSSQTRSSTRNYELNKTTSFRKPTPGRVQRLSVAVLVDYLPKADPKDAKAPPVPTALGKEELARIEALVKEAMGFDAARGDTVTVQNAPFIVAPVEAIAPLPMMERPEVLSLTRQGVTALVLLVLILAVVRPMLKSIFTTPTGGAAALAATRLDALPPPTEGSPEAVQAARHAALAAPPSGPSPYDQKLTLARETVKQDPKRVAQVMKTWIAQES